MISETVTILRRQQTGTDRYGKAVYGWPEPGEDVQVLGFAPEPSQEPNEVGRRAVITNWTLYLPTGVSLGPFDRVRARGITYEVDGDVGDWRNPYTGSRPGLQVALKRVEG